MNAAKIVFIVLSLLSLLVAVFTLIPATRRKVLDQFKKESTVRTISLLFLIAGVMVMILFIEAQYSIFKYIVFIQGLSSEQSVNIFTYITTPAFWMSTFVNFSGLLLIFLGFTGLFRPSRIIPVIEQEGSPWFNDASINKWNLFIKALKSDNPQSKRIYDLFDDESRQIIDNFKEKDKLSDENRKKLLVSLNGILKKEDLYDEKAFQEASSSGKLKKFLEAKFLNKLDNKTLPEFNRTLLETVFKGQILDFTIQTFSSTFIFLTGVFYTIAASINMIEAFRNPAGFLNM